MFTKSFTFGLSMLLFLGGPAVAATKAIRLGKLVDGTGRVLTNAIVIVENDRIAAVTSAANTIPAGAEVVDLSRYTGIPGMIDAHTHMTYGPGPATPGTRSTIVNMVLGQDALKKTLEAGVTHVDEIAHGDIDIVRGMTMDVRVIEAVRDEPAIRRKDTKWINGRQLEARREFYDELMMHDGQTVRKIR